MSGGHDDYSHSNIFLGHDPLRHDPLVKRQAFAALVSDREAGESNGARAKAPPLLDETDEHFARMHALKDAHHNACCWFQTLHTHDPQRQLLSNVAYEL